MTHRAYKNEYSEEFLTQIINGRIKGLCATGQESEKVIIIEGELEVLQKFAGLMYATPEQIKAVFPDFLTEKDVENIWKKAYSNVYEALRQAIIESTCEDFGTSYRYGAEQKELLSLSVSMMERVREICK